jgi:hypothetical protein
MKRLQIMIEDEIDAELERAALEARMSKATLIRLYVRERLMPAWTARAVSSSSSG